MNSPEPLASPLSDDLPWLAFLYVSEELTPDEVVDFEDRLLTDQAAREAVAEAMKITESLRMATAMDMLAEKSLPAPEPLRGNTEHIGLRWTGWLATSLAAAGVALSVGWWMAQREDSSKPFAPAISPSELTKQEVKTPLIRPEHNGALRLVEMWSDAESLVEELAVGPAVADREEFPARESLEPEAEAFAWMLAAVSSDSAPGSTTPQDEPAVMEN